MDWVEERLLDVPKRIKDMDECGIAATILSMTSPGVQGIVDAGTAASSATQANHTIYGRWQWVAGAGWRGFEGLAG